MDATSIAPHIVCERVVSVYYDEVMSFYIGVRCWYDGGVQDRSSQASEARFVPRNG